MKRKYITISAKSLFDLETAVNEKLEDGYEIAGGVSASPDPNYINKGGYYQYHQALIKKDLLTSKQVLEG